MICYREIITDEGRTDVKHWNKLEGNSSGQTHVDVAKVMTTPRFLAYLLFSGHRMKDS